MGCYSERNGRTDGDTIKLDGTTYRVWGIDAPESQQTCADGWPAGAEATRVLTKLMCDKTIACKDRGQDPFSWQARLQ
jgi:endonuclease YncB( thermonuclease family)